MAISYSPTIWEDNVTPVNEENMNKIEQGIANAYAQVNNNTNNITQNANKIAQNTQDIAQNSADITALQQQGSGLSDSNLSFMMGKPTTISTPFATGSIYDFNYLSVSATRSNWTKNGNDYSFTVDGLSLPTTADYFYFVGAYVSGINVPTRATAGYKGITMRIDIPNYQSILIELTHSSSSAVSNCSIGCLYPFYFGISDTNYNILTIGGVGKGNKLISAPIAKSEVGMINYYEKDAYFSEYSTTINANLSNTSNLVGLLPYPIKADSSMTCTVTVENVTSEPTFDESGAEILAITFQQRK